MSSGDIRLVRHQFRFDAKRFLRDPAGLFYAIGFPLIFLVNFLVLLGDSDEIGHVAGHALPSKYYYLPGVITITVVSITIVNLTVSLVTARERGTLKRVRGTPVPTWAFLGGRIATSLAAIAIMVTLVATTGWIVYGVRAPGTALVGALLVLTVATVAFCCLAFALTAILPTAGTAAAITMTGTLILYFISGIFAREDNLSAAVRALASIFPVKRLYQALAVAYDPTTTGTAIRWWDLTVIAAWGLAGLVLALRYFGWQPRSN